MRLARRLLALGAALAVFGTSDVAAAQGGAVTTGNAAKGEGEPRAGRRSQLKFGIEGDYNNFGDFASVAGNQVGIQNFTGDNTNVGFGAFLEYLFDKRCPWYWGLEYHRNTLKYTQVYRVGYRDEGELVGSNVGLYTGYGFRLSRVSILPKIGVVRANDELAIKQLLGSAFVLGSRSLTNYKTTLGVNVDVPLFVRRLTARVGTDYTTGFKSDDADAYWSAHLGVSWRYRF